MNNHVLGMVRQWQNLFYGKRYSHTVLNDAVDFVKLAEAMGAKGLPRDQTGRLKAGSGGSHRAAGTGTHRVPDQLR